MTETWLTDNIVNAEIAISGYTLYRADRIGRQRGGVAVYVRPDLSVAPISNFSNGNIETLLLKVKSLDAIIICVYRSQTSDSDPSQWAQLINDMSESIEMT